MMERPPESGKGSSVEAWREYAAAVTDSPVESWAALSRDEIVELLDAEGAEQPGDADGSDEREGDRQREPRPLREWRPGPQWMVPTDDGPVPESVLRHEQMAERRAKAAKAQAAREAAEEAD